jgi:predicted DNA-binding transcriptional regulator AlpA
VSAAPLLIRQKEVARLLGVSASGLLRLRRSAPDFPAPLPLPGAVRWARADVESWIDGLRLRARAAQAVEAELHLERPGAV